jgi:hypothetical protein
VVVGGAVVVVVDVVVGGAVVVVVDVVVGGAVVVVVDVVVGGAVVVVVDVVDVVDVVVVLDVVVDVVDVVVVEVVVGEPAVRMGVNVVVNFASDIPDVSGKPPSPLIVPAAGHVAGAGAVGIAGIATNPSTVFAIPVVGSYAVPVAVPLVPVVRFSASGPTGHAVFPARRLDKSSDAVCGVLSVRAPVPGSIVPVQSAVGMMFTVVGTAPPRLNMNGGKLMPAIGKVMLPEPSTVPSAVPMIPVI